MLHQIKKAYDKTVERDTAIWKGSFYGLLFVAGIAFIGMSLGMPTGMGAWLDIPIMTGLALVFMSAVSIVGAGLFTLARLPLPRLFISGLISIYCTLSFSFIQFNISYLGSAIVTIIIVVIGILCGSSITLVLSKGWAKHTGLYAVFSIVLLMYGLYWLISPGKPVYESIRPEDSAYSPVTPAAITDPSQPGEYEVISFTYGREQHADYVTDHVDASAFLSAWHPLRKLYWGFDESRIPIEGKVWMPDGEGPFPLVLIVHGSSKMEKPSVEGYDYLGELWASRGFITMSVEESFINFSVWSQGMDWDMTIRAWVLLQHLRMIEQAMLEETSPFYNKVDGEQVALIGHSRGGQAVALASSFAEFYNEEHHPEISLHTDLTIKAVGALAPIDRLIHERFIRLRGVDYFTIQGAHDSDVNTFYGDRQFRRTYWAADEQGFKASLYVQGVSHGHFNTVWGNQDTTMPTTLLLNKGEILDGDAQRQIAKVMMTAFLEASLHGKRQYINVLRDYRHALNWLPETTYVNRFEDHAFINVSNYEGDRDLHTTRLFGGEFTAQHMTTWEEQELLFRNGQSTLNHAVRLGWDGETEANYTLSLPSEWAKQRQLSQDASLVFSLANADLERTQPYEAHEVPRISIAFVAEDGATVRLPLSDFRSYPPLIHSRYTKLPIFEKTIKFGRLGKSIEPVFQLYDIPLEAVVTEQKDFDISLLKEIRFIFEEGAVGQVFMDDIGFSLYKEGY